MSLPLKSHYVIVVVAAMLTGCQRDNGYAKFIPAEKTAENALEKALTFWRDQGKTGLVQQSQPAIELADTHKKPGQKLAGFTILGPTTGEAPRVFAVQLKFASPAETVRARYAVFGNDPLWVVRYEDYEMLSHWDHPPAASDATKRTP